MFKRFVEVKPARANDESTDWIVFEGNRFDLFLDDLRRYGWRVALYNVKVLLFGGAPKS